MRMAGREEKKRQTKRRRETRVGFHIFHLCPFFLFSLFVCPTALVIGALLAILIIFLNGLIDRVEVN